RIESIRSICSNSKKETCRHFFSFTAATHSGRRELSARGKRQTHRGPSRRETMGRARLLAIGVLAVWGIARAEEDTVRPLAGRDTVTIIRSTATSDWCDGFRPSERDADRFRRRVERAYEAHGLSDETLSLVGRLACEAPGDSEAQRLVANVRQQFVNAIGM